jgi:UDP-glucose 4-epimerase
MVERMLDWFHRLHGLRYASLRYFNAAGARQDHGEAHGPESHLIPRVLQVVLGQSKSIAVYGNDYATPDGTCVRDYIHISDLASAHVLVLNALESGGRRIYNLGNGRGFSVLEVIETARQVTGHPIPVQQAPRRPGDPDILVASSKKIRKELGWEPRLSSLSEIIRTSWDWHSSHPNGYSAE